MKNKTLITILSIAAIAGVRLYFLNRMKKKGEQKAEDIKEQGEAAEVSIPEPPAPIITGNPLANIANTISNFLTSYNDYVVATQSTALTLREKPDAKSKAIGSFKKGSVIRAKASDVKGWFAVSQNGKDIKGYVSSVYLKAKPKA